MEHRSPETTHGISLGETYRNNRACRFFVGYIAEAERLAMVEDLTKAPFYSALTDGSRNLSIREAECKTENKTTLTNVRALHGPPTRTCFQASHPK